MNSARLGELAVANAPPQPIASRWPIYAEDEIAAASGVLRSGRVNALHHGEQCGRFEAGFAALCDMPHAIALANGTLALEVALRALGVGSGDEVIVPARSFVASASCVVACGARPIFADVDPVTQGLTADFVAPLLTGRTRAIIIVHIGGYPAAADEVAELAGRHGAFLIEDCAQAHGATLGGKPVGGFGDAAAFSFCTDKIMSTGGEGGMLVVRDPDVARRAWSMKDHGKDRVAATHQASGQSFRWLHGDFGSNYRLTEMQAAIGLAQLAKLGDWLDARRRNARAILDELGGCPALRLIDPPPQVGHAYYKFYAFVRPEALRDGWDRDRILKDASRNGVPCQSGVCPEIYRERAFVAAGFAPDHPLPIARRLGETSLMLPVDPTLDEATSAMMAGRLRAVVQWATR